MSLQMMFSSKRLPAEVACKGFLSSMYKARTFYIGIFGRHKQITHLKKQSIQVHKPMPFQMMLSSKRLSAEVTSKGFLSSMN